MPEKRTARKPAAVVKELPIKWVVPDDLVSHVATNLVVQHSEHEFYISFFEAAPPIIVGGPENVAKTLDTLANVPARCVARIIVAAGRMPEFVDVLTRNLAGFEARHGAASKKS